MVLTYKNKFNVKYGYRRDEPHSLEGISQISGYKLDHLKMIYSKGIGAYKTNPSSVRPTVKSPQQWGIARVYASLNPDSKAHQIDKEHLVKK